MADQYEQIITAFPLFQGYTSHGAHSMLERGEIRQLKTGQALFNEGDPADSVVLLLTGLLRAFLNRKGNELVLMDATPGTIVGELGVLCGLPRAASVRAVQDSTVLQWKANAFRTMLLGDSMLSERIFRQSLRMLIEKEKGMIDTLLKSQGVA